MVERWGDRGEVIFAEVEQQWRPLFAIAWADFHRFLLGWCPGHWKQTGFSDRMVEIALASVT